MIDIIVSYTIDRKCHVLKSVLQYVKAFFLQLSQHLCQSVCFVSCLFQTTASATEPYCSASAVDWTTATVGCLVAVSASVDLSTCVFCELYLHKCVIYIIFLGCIAVLRTYVLLTVSNEVAWSVGRCVCLSVCHTSHTCKTVPLIRILFGLKTQMCPGNHVSHARSEEAILRRKEASHCKLHQHSAVMSARMLKWSICLFNCVLACAIGYMLDMGTEVLWDGALPTNFCTKIGIIWLSLNDND